MINYSTTQYEGIEAFFDSNRHIPVSEVVASLGSCYRKPYYVSRAGQTDPESIICTAIAAKIDPEKITGELFLLTNYSLSDENTRNAIIFDGINKQWSIECINKALLDAGEFPL